MKALLLILALTVGTTAYSKEAVIEGGRSKDGRFEVRIVDDGSSDISDYLFTIYDTRSKKSLIKLRDVGGYHRYDAASQEAKALWNDASSFVALTDSDSRHTERLYIFHVTDSSARRLDIPDFKQNALGRVDATESDLHSHHIPNRWDGNQLHVIFIFAVAHATRGRIHYECEAVLECAHLDSFARLRRVTQPQDVERE